MPLEEIFNIKQFGGLKNDENSKQIPFNYFYLMRNFDYPDNGILGMRKILMPEQIRQIGTSQIDGLVEYKYLDSTNVLQTEQIAVTNGEIYKDALAVTPTLLKSGLQTGLVSFAIFQDKLFIANGKNYVNVYWGEKGVISEMGAPAAVVSTAGNVDVGDHYYAMTYITAGGEEILGSVSNTITISSTAKIVTLSLPIGYSGTLNRNIYRTKAGGTTLYLLTNIANNTTLTYSDNTADSGLSATKIPATNNELPKPYFLNVANNALYGAKVDIYPTQIFKTDAGIELWDTANFIDVGNLGNDNTAVEGIGVDFSNIMVGTSKNIYLLDYDASAGTTSVIPTRANVGIKSGHTVRQVPAYGDFAGGLLFISTLNDLRLMNGMNALPVSTSINNIRTENWSQNIMGSLNNLLNVYTSIYAEFYKYKYILCIDNEKYVFDIRTAGWSMHDITTTTYQSKPRCLAVISGNLYNGQPDGWIEQEYYSVKYRSEDCLAYIQSPEINVSEKYKQAMKLIWWFEPSVGTTVNITVVADSNDYYPLTGTFNLTSGYFNTTYYNSTYFSTGTADMDYKVMNINIPCRWFRYRLTISTGNASLQNVSAIGLIEKSKQMTV